MRNPAWTRDEHIVVLNFYLIHSPRIPGPQTLEIKDLSQKLNRISSSLEVVRSQSFRNPSSVYMKLMNFRRFDSSYEGVGLGHGSKDEEIVWNLFSSDPKALNVLAQQICDLSHPNGEPLPAIPDEEEEGNEGQVLSRVHRFRERNKTLVAKKKRSVLQTHAKLFCEGCGFDFEMTYGARGKDFIECHHTKPISELEPDGVTKLKDLVLVCSNCHRMIHRWKPWLTLSELRDTMRRDST